MALLKDGQLLAFGSPAQVLTVAHVAQAFGVETEALHCADGTGVLVPKRSVSKHMHAMDDIAMCAL